MSMRQWLGWAVFNLLIIGMVFAFVAAMWSDKPKIIFTPDIQLNGSANDR